MNHSPPRPPPRPRGRRHRGWADRWHSHRHRAISQGVSLEARLGARTELPPDHADPLEEQIEYDPDPGYWDDTDPLLLLRLRTGLLDRQRFARCLASALPAANPSATNPATNPVPIPIPPETFPEVVARIEAAWNSLAAGDSRLPGILEALAPLAAHPFLRTLTASDLTLDLLECLVPVVILRDFWIRPVEAWTPPAPGTTPWWRDLLAHLLVHYPIPAWLDPRSTNLWGPRTRPADYLLLVAAGQGWSLTAAARVRFQAEIEAGDLPPAALRHLAEVPVGHTPYSAPSWMLIRHLGGDETLYACLNTRGVGHLSDARLLGSLVPWMLRHRPDFHGPAEIQAIITWAVHQSIEAGRNAAESATPQPFSMKGRSLKKVREAAAEYQALLAAQQQAHAPYRAWAQIDVPPWNRRGWDWAADHAGTRWSVRELCSSAELLQETQAQRHCVVTYASGCAAGRCAIFSITEAGERRVTVEVRLPSRQVVQVRGFANRQPTPTEDSFVRRWQAHTLPP